MNFKILFLAIFLTGCYSFRGSLPSNLKSLHIERFSNRETRERNYAPELSSQVQTAFLDDNSLLVSGKKSADLILSGSIESISQKMSSVTITANAATSDNYILTVNVSIVCLIKETKKELVKTNVSHEVNIKASDSDSRREEVIKEALNEITTQIVDKVIGAW